LALFVETNRRSEDALDWVAGPLAVPLQRRP
jgi:hypothetical protein